MSLARKDGTAIFTEKYEGDGERLVVVIAGFGYTVNHPHLHYARNAAKEAACDCITIDFEYTKNRVFEQLSDQGKDAYFEEDTSLVKTYLEGQGSRYREMVIIGKSMGTSVIRRLFASEDLIRKSKFVLMTPGTEWNAIIPLVCEMRNAFLVIGSKGDAYYTVEGLARLYGRPNIKMVEFAEGNHSIETGIFEKDIEITKRIIREIRAFIDTGYSA
jgi:hypothetical protein